MGRRARAAEGWLTVSQFVELVGIHGMGKNAVDNARALLAEFAFEGEDAALEVERDGRPLTELGFRAVPTGGLIEIRVRDQARFDEVVERLRAAKTFDELNRRGGGEGVTFSDVLNSKPIIDMIREQNIREAAQAAGFAEAISPTPKKFGIDFSKLVGKPK